MKIICWNVNGIRAVINKNFFSFLKEHNPDIVCLQETKYPKEPMLFPAPGYEVFWNHAVKPGYSGTAILAKPKTHSVANHIGIKKHDQEGRVIAVELDKFYLVNVYVPNSKRGLERLDYRTKEWDVDFLKYLKELEKKKPVVACGDFNVAHQEIDLTYPKTNTKSHGFTPEERAGFDNIVKAGFCDVFREFEKGPGHYTWWSPFANCRKRNIGWRIDYFIASPILLKKIKSCRILKDVMGSDHCPIELTIES